MKTHGHHSELGSEQNVYNNPQIGSSYGMIVMNLKSLVMPVTVLYNVKPNDDVV
jgi:hypothetical protein